MGITINNESRTPELPLKNSQIHWGGGGGGINAFYWYQIFVLDSAVVEAQVVLSLLGGLITIAMYHHRETILKSIYRTLVKQRKWLMHHRAKENSN